ncbi:MAG: ATP-binding protein [Flavipsychrobacter sp.]
MNITKKKTTPSLNGSSKSENDNTNSWHSIGTVVGNAGIGEFSFILKQFSARVGDIVTIGMDIPDSKYAGKDSIYVWARITDIHRFNPFFPFEAAQEIAGEGISLEDTILSGTRDQLEASALILGATTRNDISTIFPLTYPVKPASTVYHPPTNAVRALLISGRSNDKNARIGTLIARNDVEVNLSASKLVSRHMAILAMTGGGKTVAARRIIRELIGLGYPMLILDPHGDYIGLVKCQDKLKEENENCEIKLFFPSLLMQRDGEDLVLKLISQMTNGITEPQSDYLRGLFDRAPATDGQDALEYIDLLLERTNREVQVRNSGTGNNTNTSRAATMGAVARSLRIVQEKLNRMEYSSKNMRTSSKLKDLPFEALPNPFSSPEDIIQPNQVSILYLGGYDHITQCSIAAIVLERLFEYRVGLSGKIPPFLTVIEEAHTFIPSAREGTHDAVTLPVVRRIVTEGRKFGTGLMLISQRPNRLDETIISQCNSFLILRLVNPNDQRFVKNIMENLTEADARLIPGFGPGQGIVSGQAVRFPLPVKIQMDEDLLNSEIGDEDFFDQVAIWKPDINTTARKKNKNAIEKLNNKKNARKR